jgi:flagellar biosynthesis/type III secretory pathway protein FliH
MQIDLQKNLQTSFELAQKDIESYKASRIKDFEKELFTIVQKISAEILQKELTQEEHEKQVMKALERAKEEKLFS